MPLSTDPFGTFEHDKSRLEAVRLRERRLFWLGIANVCERMAVVCATTVICIFSDQPATIAASLGAIFQTLMR